MKKLFLLLSILFISISASYAQPHTSNTPLNITEVDGSPSTFPYKLKVSNGALTDNGDGTATLGNSGESTNQDWSLAIASPSAVTDTTEEVASMGNFQGNMYIGYDNSPTNNGNSSIYKWDGKTNTLFYTIGKGPGFEHVNSIVEYNNKLFVTNSGNTNGQGSVYVYDPLLTPTNFIQFPTLTGSSASNSVTVSNDSSNNAIFGSTAFSLEYYGRIDSVSSSGVMIRKKNSSGNIGYNLSLDTSQHVLASIVEGGTNKATTTSTTISIGNYHDIVMSWTSASAPKVYIDGVEAGYSVSTAVTTPSDDTTTGLIIGNNIANSAPFQGNFKRVRLWRGYALTGADVTSLNGGGAAASSPTGQYLFTEGTGTTTADSSGNNNTATLNGNVYWNNTLFDLSYSSGNDKFIYALSVFKGNLYAGAGFSTSNIYSYNGTTWTQVYTGLANNGLVQDMTVYKGQLFVSLGGTAHSAIISTSDGATWNVEKSLLSGSGFTRFTEFKGKLYVGFFGSSNQIYVRDDTAVTWSPAQTFSGPSQCWGLANYNNALYLGCTLTNNAVIYKSYDGLTFVTDFTNNTSGGQGREAFTMNHYNGSLYVGMGFLSGDADIWRKTDSIGQLTDNIYRFIRRFRGYTNSAVNWTEDDWNINVSPPWNFDSIVSFATNGINWYDINNINPNTNINWNVVGDSIGRVLTRTASGINWSDMSSGGAGDMTKAVYDAAAISQQLVGTSATQTLTNKRITKRIVTAADATSITPNSDNADITYQLNTQALGTLTINADSGTPTNGQAWLLKINSTNVQTFAWNAVFVGGTVALPTTTTGGSKIDYFCFIYDTVNSKWHYTGTAQGF